MDLKHIRYFVAVAEAGSFTAAARIAFVSQPTLSAAIKALETEIGETLFERRARGATLTAAGRRRLPEARAVLRALETFRRDSPGKPRPVFLRFGILPTLCSEVASSSLAKLLATHSITSWRTELAPIEQLERRLHAGRYDAILSLLGRETADEEQCRVTTDRLSLAMPVSHSHAVPLTPRVLDNAPLIVRTHCEFLHPASRILDSWGVRPRVIARIDSDSLALSMVAAGLGSCLMPDSFRHENVKYIQPEGVDFARAIGWRWLRGSVLTTLRTSQSTIPAYY